MFRIMAVFVLALAVLTLLPRSVGAADGGTGPSRSIASGSTLHGAFVQERRLQGFKAPLISEGRFTLAPGQGLVWRSEKPFAVTTVITAAGLVQEVDGTETVRMPAARLPFLAKLYDMLGGALAGDWSALDKEFTVVRQGNDRAWRVELRPRVAADPVSMPITTIRLTGGLFVDQVEIVREGGDSDVLHFADQTLSQAPPSPEETRLLVGVGR